MSNTTNFQLVVIAKQEAGGLIPAKAGIQKTEKTWIPYQARLAKATAKRVRDDNDNSIFT